MLYCEIWKATGIWREKDDRMVLHLPPQAEAAAEADAVLSLDELNGKRFGVETGTSSGEITQAQHDRSLHDLTVKMGMAVS